MSKRPTILIGGKRRDARNYMERINYRVKRLEAALRPKKERPLLPGEEKQFMLPGLEKKKVG